jgi:hypothetical protein
VAEGIAGPQIRRSDKALCQADEQDQEKEYFKAMAKIEKGEINGYYRFDLELQEIFEKEKLFIQ